MANHLDVSAHQTYFGAWQFTSSASMILARKYVGEHGGQLKKKKASLRIYIWLIDFIELQNHL